MCIAKNKDTVCPQFPWGNHWKKETRGLSLFVMIGDEVWFSDNVLISV